MTAFNPDRRLSLWILTAVAAASVMAMGGALWTSAEPHRGAEPPAGSSRAPYAGMAALAPIGVRVERYAAVPEFAKGPAIDPDRGYRTQKLGDGLYMITDGAYQSMFMTYEQGVVVIDAPPSYASHLSKAIAAVSDKPVTHLVYSHYHVDHIAGARALGGNPVIIAHKETNRILARDSDPNRPLATVTFDDNYRLTAGSQVLELSYHGNAHAPGNIFIHAPKQRTLMVVDVVFPGWMPWRRLAVSQDIPEVFAQVKAINNWDFDTFVGGHVARTGTHEDVALQLAFMEDLKSAAQNSLSATVPGDGLDPADRGNPWAIFDHYIDRVALGCVNLLTPKWAAKLAAYDVYIWDQCFAMEQSLRID